MAEPVTVDIVVAHRLTLKLATVGPVTVVMGPSGSGKTTLLSSLAGLVRPTGRIVYGDEVWLDADHFVPPAARRVGLVPQSLALFPHLDGADNVAFGIDAKLGRAARRKESLSWLERMRVGHLANRRPSTYSGGEAQRVALARAFARRPRLVLLDEPFSALDRPLRQALTSDLRVVIRDLDATLIHVTHDEEEAAALAGVVHRLG